MKFLERLFGGEARSASQPELEQAEREAIVDLLLLAMYVDGHVSLSESQEFDAATDAMGWASTTAPSVYFSTATDRARSASSSEDSTAQLIQYVSERLQSVDARARAMDLLNRLFLSDGRTEKEKDFFKQVEVVFQPE